MTNKQIARHLKDIHEQMRRSMDVVYAHLEAIETVSDAPHSRLHNALDGLYYASRDVLAVKEAIESEAGQGDEEVEQ